MILSPSPFQQPSWWKTDTPRRLRRHKTSLSLLNSEGFGKHGQMPAFSFSGCGRLIPPLGLTDTERRDALQSLQECTASLSRNRPFILNCFDIGCNEITSSLRKAPLLAAHIQ